MDSPYYDYNFTDSDYNDTDYNFTDLYDPVTDPPIPPISPVHWSALVVYVFVFVLGLPGNAMVVWMTGCEMKRTVNTVWFLNLAVADLMCCLAVPFSIMGIILRGHWPLGLFACKFISSILLVNMYASVLTLTLISMDLWALVVKPDWCQKYRSVKNASWTCLVVWLLALVLNSPSFIFRRTYFPIHFHNKMAFCSVDFSLAGPNHEMVEISIAVLRFMLGFIIPFLVICVCYGVLVSTVNTRITQSRKTVKVVLVVVIGFFVCWFPYHVAGLILSINHNRSELFRSTLRVDPVLISLAFINSCINPIIYGLMGKSFRTKFKKSIKSVIQEVQELSQSLDSKRSKTSSETKHTDTPV